MSRVLRCPCLPLLFVFSLLAFADPLSAEVVINEIHYNPDVKTEPAEFIELFNAGLEAVDLSSWRITGGVAYTFPEGTSIASGACAVLAQDPATILSKFGVSALGPWTGKLNNDGETIKLVNAAGATEDEVDYQLGFPWPTVGDPPGYSIELINPAFDNSLGGNWRRSVVGDATSGALTLISSRSSWKYFPGLSEASSPATAWRQLDFDDSSWAEGRAPIGYDPSLHMGTSLDDMRYNYTTVFFRKTFVIENVTAIRDLVLEALYDDGFKVWINGHPIRDGAFNMAAGEVPFYGSAGLAIEDNSFNEFTLDGARSFLVPGTNVLAIQAANASIGGSSDFFWDARLLAQTGPASHGPIRAPLILFSLPTRLRKYGRWTTARMSHTRASPSPLRPKSPTRMQ